MTVVVEIAGLELPGRHGALEREREQEQPFVYDVELELDGAGLGRSSSKRSTTARSWR